MILEKLASILAEHTDREASTITMDTPFESLGLDSLDTVELLMELEEDLGVPLDLQEKVDTVGDLVAFIENKLGDRS